MTAAELTAYVAQVRAQAHAVIARIDAIDLDALPADVRAEYEALRAGWRDVLAMTESEAVEPHIAACLHVGREPDRRRAARVDPEAVSGGDQGRRPCSCSPEQHT